MSAAEHTLNSWQKTASCACVCPYSTRAVSESGSPGRMPRGSRSRLKASTLPIGVTRRYALYSELRSEKSVSDGWLRGPKSVGRRSVPET